MLTKLLFRFLDADKRTVLIRKNIIGSIALKTISLFFDFLIVPLSLAFLTETNYGIWIITSLRSFILLLLFYPILGFWVGDSIDVPISLAIQSVIFVILLKINSVYTYFLNGVSKINIQMLTQIITIIINIPLSIFFAKTLGLGMSGILLATNCSLLMYVIIRKIQYEKIINNRAYGIWNK
jgi:O-antigen/teichoic acid export membrane protein